MIEPKQKKCKSTGKAKNYQGCGNPAYKRIYGLCMNCYRDWLLSTPEGKEKIEKTKIKAVKKVKEESKPKRKYIKWQDKPTNEMIQYIQDSICNPYIRQRDIEKYGIHACISGGGKISDAGHYFNVKNNQRLRFCVQNIHGQSYSHNRDSADPGHLIEYKQGLIARYDKYYLRDLETLQFVSKDWAKLTRIDYIEIGKTYEKLTKKKIWVFHHLEFENYKNILNK